MYGGVMYFEFYSCTGMVYMERSSHVDDVVTIDNTALYWQSNAPAALYWFCRVVNDGGRRD